MNRHTRAGSPLPRCFLLCTLVVGGCRPSPAEPTAPPRPADRPKRVQRPPHRAPARVRPAPPRRRRVAVKPVRPQPVTRAAWNAWRKKFPDLKDYQLLAVDPVPLQKLLAWIPKGKTGSVYDRRCRRIRVTRQAQVLQGRRATGRSISGKSMTISHDGYTFDSRILLTDGGTDSYKRRGRKWVKVGGSAHGCANNVGLVLSKVTAGSAYYDAALVSLYVACGAPIYHKQHCQRGGQRDCRSCSSWTIQMKSRMYGHRYGRTRSPTVTVGLPSAPRPVDCRKPCPSKAKYQAAKDLARFLRGRRFLHRSSPDHPYLFRSKKACRSYRKRKKISKDELNVW